MKRFALLVALVSTLAPAGSHGVQGLRTEALRQRVSEVARRAGLDPGRVFAHELAVRVPAADGTPVLRRATVDQWLRVFGDAPDEAGLGGLPEITAGDVVHAYLNVGVGIDPSYSVTTSAVVPATPAIYPPAPAGLLFFEAGGPLTQVKGSYAVGFHTAGTAIGSNVDTGGSGPYLPVVDTALVPDSRIDFIGHVESIDQEGLCVLETCLLWIGAMIGDGVMIWDTADPSLPIIP